jgi:hypothetical protein
MNKIVRVLALVLPILSTVSGCTTAVVAGAAAAGGYIAHEKGYRIRNPITKKSGTEGKKAGNE